MPVLSTGSQMPVGLCWSLTPSYSCCFLVILGKLYTKILCSQKLLSLSGQSLFHWQSFTKSFSSDLGTAVATGLLSTCPGVDRFCLGRRRERLSSIIRGISWRSSTHGACSRHNHPYHWHCLYDRTVKFKQSCQDSAVSDLFVESGPIRDLFQVRLTRPCPLLLDSSDFQD